MMSGRIEMSSGEVTLAELIETEFLKCHECKSSYNVPRLLPCLHTFCEKCISNIAQKTVNKKSLQKDKDGDVSTKPLDTTINTNGYPENTLICPICLATVGIPKEGEKSYPINTLLQNLCEMYDYKHEKERYCEYCQFDNKKVKATFLCLECQDNICNTCSDNHRRTKVTRSHKVIPFVQIEKGLFDHDIREHQEQKCPQHKDEAFEMFCEKCEQLVCKECKVSYHDNHKWSKTEKAATMYRTQMENLLGGLQRQTDAIHNYIQFLTKYSDSIEETMEKLLIHVNQQAECMHKMVEEQKIAFIEAIGGTCQREKAELNAKKVNLDAAATSLRSNATYLRHLLNHGKPNEVLSIHQGITQRLTQLTHMQLDGISSNLRMHFSEGSLTKQNVEILFGKLTIDRIHTDQQESLVTEGPGLSIKSILPNVKNNPEIIISFDSHIMVDTKDVWPTGIAVTKDNEFVIVDRDNKRIKIFDEYGKEKSYFNGEGENKLGSPFDVTILNNGNIAVTDHEFDDVKVFSPKGVFQMSIKGQFKYPRGITVNKKGEIIVLDCRLQQLTIHDSSNGKFLRTIEGKDSKGSKVLVDPYYVTVTPNDDIIVTDTASPNIKVFSPSGQFLAHYGQYGTGTDQVLQPYGVCTDHYGYIFVADSNNHRIHLLLPDGKFSKFLVTKAEGLWHPIGIAISRRGYLVVTEGLGKIKVYKYI
ncbi:hypothetical protein CHS0354_037020 [Potamilus streckersoni]|uniref:Uncharacterized protein n=1 Tax=Potamilus streckersoni TaxID=2493646 RepID=A0AAE0SK15_9BIVA|nr:hypothetical protein CHS0354_037020 [Potamilus streckersoni]